MTEREKTMWMLVGMGLSWADGKDLFALADALKGADVEDGQLELEKAILARKS